MYILFISLVFFLIGYFIVDDWTKALPIALIGGGVGWALTEFKRETNKREINKRDGEN